MPLPGCVEQQIFDTLHIVPLCFCQLTPRRLPTINLAMHLEVSPSCLLVQLIGPRRQLQAAHGAHLLDAKRPEPLDTRSMKGVGAGKGGNGARRERVQADGVFDRILVRMRDACLCALDYWRCRLRRPLFRGNA